MRLRLVERNARALLCAVVALAAVNLFGIAKSQDSPRQDVATATAAASAASDPVPAPEWEVGDEWQYAYKSKSGSGTFVWSVNRIEAVDGVPHYVVKSGTREILYRVSDLTAPIERTNGAVVIRNTPPRLVYVWPLAVGTAWDQSYMTEWPVDRRTENRNARRTVEREEKVTVPAGTFRTLKIVARNANTNELLYELWYAPDVKQWVKDKDAVTGQERELLAFKLSAPTASVPPSAGPRTAGAPPQAAADLTAAVAALVKRYEALQPTPPVADAERAALAHDIVEAARFRELQVLSVAEFSQGAAAQNGSPTRSPKLKEALVVTLVAAFQPDRIVPAFERELAEGLDVSTLRTGAAWERSDLGQRIRRLEIAAVNPEALAAKKAFTEQFVARGATATDDRTRSCAQKGITDDSAEAALPILEAFFRCGVDG